MKKVCFKTRGCRRVTRTDLHRHLRQVVGVAEASGDVELEVPAELNHVVTEANIVQSILHMYDVYTNLLPGS